jgi:hypothetical protein
MSTGRGFVVERDFLRRRSNGERPSSTVWVKLGNLHPRRFMSMSRSKFAAKLLTGMSCFPGSSSTQPSTPTDQTQPKPSSSP